MNKPSNAPKAIGVKIEKGIPLPPPVRGATNSSIYPWRQMEVGDSFMIPNAVKKTVDSAAHGFAKRLKWKFAVRKVEGGIRVWRVE